MDLFVFTFRKEKQLYRALSPLNPQQVSEFGLPTEAVLGQIDAVLPSMTPDQFEQNEAFIALVHAAVQAKAPEIPELQAEAKTLSMGRLYVMDGRAGRVTGEVGQDDIIGSFALRRGEILADQYEANPHYRVLTDNGPLQLPAPIETAVLIAIDEALHAADMQPHGEDGPDS